jgi:hypothetical protein
VPVTESSGLRKFKAEVKDISDKQEAKKLEPSETEERRLIKKQAKKSKEWVDKLKWYLDTIKDNMEILKKARTSLTSEAQDKKDDHDKLIENSQKMIEKINQSRLLTQSKKIFR